jgi:hypothetical protein
MTPQEEAERELYFKTDRRGAQRSDAPVRRHSERIYGPCVAIVRGVDAGGEEFTESTVLDNISAGGMYLKLRREVSQGARLFIVFAFSTIALQDVEAPRVAAHGEVRRVDMLQSDPIAETTPPHGVAIQFQHHRFL